MANVWKARIGGPLAAHADTYREWLARSGYTPISVEAHVRLMAQLSRFMAEAALDSRGLSTAAVGDFRRQRARQGYAGNETFSKLVQFLRSEGLSPTPLAESSEIDELVGRFSQHLSLRGLASSTRTSYVQCAKGFLTWHVATSGRAGDELITAEEVGKFLTGETGRLAPGTMRTLPGRLRSLIHFLVIEGRAGPDLANAVPSVRRSPERIPKTAPPESVAAMTACCDQTRAAGIRDHAILMLLSRLGLRSVELARMHLEDFNWRAGEVTIHGKNRFAEPLPLPVDVGASVAEYLARSRPKSCCRAVFLTCRAPIHELGSATISGIVHKLALRAGVPPVCAHALRHGVATQLLRKGAGLPEIAQLLRQRDLTSTSLYARVDFDSLRRVALEWPGVGR
jgi:integrase/recombinase XerD